MIMESGLIVDPQFFKSISFQNVLLIMTARNKKLDRPTQPTISLIAFVTVGMNQFFNVLRFNLTRVKKMRF